MIEVKRVGRFRGVWRLVDHDQGAVSVRLWFDEARARRAARKIESERRQNSLDL